MNLRVGTFNIRNALAFDGCNSWLFRRRATADMITALDADVVGLQEAYGFQAGYLHHRLRDHGLTGDGRSALRRGERCAVIFRQAVVELTASETRWYGDEPGRPGIRLPRASFPRVATIATFGPVHGGDPPFTFVNTHLDEHHEDNRVTAAKQLLGWLDDGPSIVVGDLNAGPDSRVLATLEAGGLRTVLPPDAPGTNHDFTGRTDGRRIDHILVSSHWEIGPAEVVTGRPRGRLPSDHWPVVADLTLAT
jgi:endonuclease/exonuclease/phosphatase family metal-dependent hydrolase